jgi:hypothetical protein
MMKNKRAGNLDEMQNQKLLKLEEYGFWVVFWALLVSIIVQLIAGAGIKEVIGEIIAFLIGSVYLTITTLKNGLWTRSSAPSRKGNALVSMIPAAVIGALNIFRMIQINGVSANALFVTVGIMAAAYAGCFAILELFRASSQKPRSELDDIGESEE